MTNTFGTLFRITTFGESHGKALGVIIDNCPPNIELSEADIQVELDRRKPGQSEVTTPRKEDDKAEILSGIFEGKTTGTPIAVVVHNTNQRSQDYDNIKDVLRPSHADFGYWQKYGIRDYRGGGRSSARETIGRVIGGAVARKILKEKFQVEIYGFSSSIGTQVYENVDRDFIEQNPLRMASAEDFQAAMEQLKSAQAQGDSLGGTLEIRVTNPPIGLGGPVFGKLEAELARAIMSIPAIKGFEMGEGFDLCAKPGSQANDPFIAEKEGTETTYRTQRNANGGVLGGISTGDDIWFRAAIKATSSISSTQTSANTKGENIQLQVHGRHDPILLPRAVPILESMTALVILDQLMLHKAQNEL